MSHWEPSVRSRRLTCGLVYLMHSVVSVFAGTLSLTLPDRRVTDVPARVSAQRRAFDAEIEPMLPRLHRLCLALAGDEDVAADVLQAALVKAWLRWEQHDGRGDRLHWLFGICRNEHAEMARTARRRRGLLGAVVESGRAILESLFTSGAERVSAEDHLARDADTQALLRALDALPDDQRVVVAMCDIDEMSYAEVAEILEIPIGTVKSRHARGRRRLAVALGDPCEGGDG